MNSEADKSIEALSQAPTPGYDHQRALTRFKAEMAKAPPDNVRRLSPRAARNIGIAIAFGALSAAAAGGIYIVQKQSAADDTERRESDAKATQKPATEAVSVVEEPASPADEQADDAPVIPTPKARKNAPKAVAKDSLVQQEARQLVEIRKALANSPAHALRLAEAGHRQFRSGILYQEREALAILALSKLGRSAQASARAKRYLETFPQSAMRSELEAIASSE